MPRHSKPEHGSYERIDSYSRISDRFHASRIGNWAERAVERARIRLARTQRSVVAQIQAVEAVPAQFAHVFSTAVVALLIVALTIPQCASSAIASDRQGASKHEFGALASLANEQGFALGELLTQARERLTELIGADYADRLIDLAGANPDVAWIATHLDEYAFGGEEVQAKVLKLTVDEPQARAFVRELPARYPADGQTIDDSIAIGETSPTEAVADAGVPHLYQWDRRWAHTVYSSSPFGLSGCGPTSLAMVYRALTGDDSMTPYDLGVLAQEGGYMQAFDGTDDGFFINVAYDLGLYCEAFYPTADYITSELEAGNVIITNFTPGYFTQFGHFAVLAGLTDDGQVIMNDPYSAERSSQTWDPGFIAQESRIMYVYSALDSDWGYSWDQDASFYW